MKTFELFVADTDWYHFKLFYHEHQNAINPDFERDCQSLLEKYTDELISLINKESQFPEFVTEIGIIEFLATKLPELGYHEVERIKFGFSDDGSLLRKAEDCKTKTQIGDKLYKAIIDHNQMVHKWSDKEFKRMDKKNGKTRAHSS